MFYLYLLYTLLTACLSLVCTVTYLYVSTISYLYQHFRGPSILNVDIITGAQDFHMLCT